MLAKFVFSDVLKSSETLGTKEDFVQLGKSVAFVMRNSGKEHFIPDFFVELLNSCKPDLDYKQLKDIGAAANQAANERLQEQKKKDDKKSKAKSIIKSKIIAKAALKGGKGVNNNIMIGVFGDQANVEGNEEDLYDEDNDFM